ncbi:alpha-D-ribose 1-methylphosphonate 5-triphosphate diphosphatase [Desulfonatronum thioautotrophicum]|uniref:alpha-D-ribose 1-methylphosphonate 5-triphosphate diphosphatase n=1 Tax=Desulfonatronum thioautotrophicum TaxID=617001 RepID=UPI000AA2E3EA|nr:alpha-D-ribose 1-methylphosphonate 5-triphosphate diphosphatase [Desulfonatronum thioautotrophicum]
MSMNRFYITRAQLVLDQETLANGAILVEDGFISAVEPLSGNGACEIDLEGRVLMPGMIDLHCDALEKDVEPRPNVYFPLDHACAQADKRNASAGITTVFHSLSFAQAELGVRNNLVAAQVLRAVHEWNRCALVDNLTHARYEVTDTEAPELLLEMMERNELDLLSFMDHTPGQGSYRDVEAYRRFLAKTYKQSEQELDQLLESKLVNAKGALARIRGLAEDARKHNVALASHDDDNPEKIELMHSLGATISEFPVNIDTARAAKTQGLRTLFGAPNILRGCSHSGCMRALDAVLEGVADILCADYAPGALLAAVFKLREQAEMPLHEAVKLVTRNPALAAGLLDRGGVAPNQRADLIAVREVGGQPLVERVWSEGRCVFTASFCHG